MAWKPPAGHVLNEGARVVWLDERGQSVFKFKGAVLEYLPVNDEDDGEIRIRWDADEPVMVDGKTRRW